MGTLMGIGGAMLLTFYKGAEIDIWSTHTNLLHHSQHGQNGHLAADYSNRLLGCILAVGSCMSYAFWLIIQVIFENFFFFLNLFFLKHFFNLNHYQKQKLIPYNLKITKRKKSFARVI